MRIAVTGASGFIGSRLKLALAAQGHEVRAIDRYSTTNATAYAGCDAVVHLANVAHGRVERELLWNVNVHATRRVAELAAQQGVRRMVYLSSVKATGNETCDRAFDGTETPHPADDYGRAKLAAEQAIFEVGSTSHLEVVVLRPPLVYGPGVKANFRSLMQALTQGWPLPLASVQNARSMIYVENLVDAIMHCLMAAQAGAHRYFVCDGEPPFSTPDLCRELGRVFGRPARLFPFPPSLLEIFPGARKLTRSLEVNAIAIRSELGWRPPYSADDGLRATARWYQGR